MNLSPCRRPYRCIAFLGVFISFALVFSQQAIHGKGAAWRDYYSYLAPLPGAQMVSAGTTIAIRGVRLQGRQLFEDIDLEVSGSTSGTAAGKLLLAGDNETVIFKKDKPFASGETVQVALISGGESLAYTFQIAEEVGGELATADWLALNGMAPQTISGPENLALTDSAPYRTAPPNFPQLEALKGSAATGAGYIFLSPFDFMTFGSNVAYLLILDDNGEPVFYRHFEGQAVIDFKRQPNGQLTYYDRTERVFFALDDQYQIVRTYEAGNGYPTNMHDLQVLDNGNYLLTIYDLRVIDMSLIVAGGQPDAQVLGCIVQELDDQDNVLFEWRSWDHFDLFDTTRDLTFKLIDYVHCNSIERDSDGHLLLSSRNFDEITKIDRQSGDIIWRLGGKQNEFTFTNDSGFSRQHDVRRLPNGHLTFYDNGVTHDPQRSRGVELAVDEQNKTVTVLGEYRDLPDVYARYMGNVQRLPNENRVVGWGSSSSPAFTEFNKLGVESLQVNIRSGEVSYRAFRYPWQGNPPWPPALIAYANGNIVDLYFSWNGSTKTAGYMIFATHEDGGEWHITNVSKSGFEDHYQVTMPQQGLWDFRVVALNQSYQPMESSESVTVIIGGQSFYVPMIAAR